MIWFTSDWHLGHLRINELAGRPFTSVDEMNDAILDTMNATVAEDDTLHIDGDLVMGTMTETLPLLTRLRCRNVVLTPGNHDRVSTMYPQKPERLADWIAKYEAVGLSITPEQTSRRVHGYKFRICHLPYRGDSFEDVDDTTGEPRYWEQRPTDHGDWLLCGHVHQAWRQRGKQINVGVDAWAGKPVSGEVVAAMAHAGPAMLDPLPWT